MAIDPRHMMTLLAIAEEGSFTRAANRLNLSQPALSSAIATLEGRLGIKLLDRTFKGTEANEFGEIIVRRAQQLRALLEATETEVKQRSIGRSGPLVFGATPGMLLKVVPEMVVRLKEMYPQQSMEIVEGWDDVLHPLLDAGELDFFVGSVTSIDAMSPSLTEEELYKDPVSLGVRPDSPLRHRKALSVRDLADAHWVLPLSGAHLRHAEAIFTTAGVAFPRLCTRTDSLSLTESLVVQTGAVTLVSHVSISRPEPHGMCAVPLIEGGYKRVVIRQSALGRPSPAAKAAVDCLRDVALAQANLRLPELT